MKKSRIRTLAALAGALIALAGCRDTESPVVAPAGAPSEALGAGVTEVAVFNDPYVDQTNWDDPTIINRVRGLIQNTPAGDTIRAAIFTFSITGVTDALIAAHNRGVSVYVVHDGGSFNSEAQRLSQALANGFYGRFIHCSGTTVLADGCISNRDGGAMYNKFLLFSRTVDAGVTKTRAVALMSGNMGQAATEHYNNLVIMAGDLPTYDGFRRVFDDMYYLRKNNNYRASANGNWESTGTQIETYFFPMADSNGGMTEQASTDQVALTLSPFSGGTGCFVKAAQSDFNSERDPIVAELVRLRSAGCTIQIAYTEMDAGVKTQLKNAGVQLRLVRATHASSSAVTEIRSRYYVAYGTYYGTPGNYRLFTGAHGWTGSSLRQNDAVMVKFREQPIVDAFLNNFSMIWGRGVPQ